MKTHRRQSSGCYRHGAVSVWAVVTVAVAMTGGCIATVLIISSKPQQPAVAPVKTGFVDPYSANTFSSASTQSTFVPAPIPAGPPTVAVPANRFPKSVSSDEDLGTEVPVSVNPANASSTPGAGIITARTDTTGMQPRRSALFGPSFHDLNTPYFNMPIPTARASSSAGSMGGTMH
jgi:hypothetical protein